MHHGLLLLHGMPGGNAAVPWEVFVPVRWRIRVAGIWLENATLARIAHCAQVTLHIGITTSLLPSPQKLDWPGHRDYCRMLLKFVRPQSQ